MIPAAGQQPAPPILEQPTRHQTTMKPTHALTVLALFAAAAAAHAATPGAGRTFGDGTLPEFLVPYDANGDGKLSAEEREAARKDRATRREEALAKWDTDGDGKLSPAELAAARKQVCEHINAIREKRFDEADTNDDGFLSQEEFEAMVPPVIPPDVVDRIFNHLAGDDGQISKEEFLRSCQPPPPPPQMPAFDVADADASGQVSLVEFVAALTAAGFTEDHASKLFARHDVNPTDGQLDPAEYPGAAPQPPKLPPFGVADADANGVVTKPEFMTAATAAGFPPLAAEDLFRHADHDHNMILVPLEYGSLLPPPPGA
jgi:Ca2+-binding EF-hand superfamily protein